MVAEEGTGGDGVTMISSGPQAGELDLAFFVFNYGPIIINPMSGMNIKV